jgi:hypothetical protein
MKMNIREVRKQCFRSGVEAEKFAYKELYSEHEILNNEPSVPSLPT